MMRFCDVTQIEGGSYFHIEKINTAQNSLVELNKLNIVYSLQYRKIRTIITNGDWITTNQLTIYIVNPFSTMLRCG